MPLREIRHPDVPKYAVSTHQIDLAITWKWEDMTPEERAEVQALEIGQIKDFKCKNLCGFAFSVRFFRKPNGKLYASGQIIQTLNMSEYDK